MQLLIISLSISHYYLLIVLSFHLQKIIMGLKYTKAVDFWSLGVLVYEMLLGQSPFQDDDEDVLYTNICTLKPYFPSSIKPEASSFVLQVCSVYFVLV